MRWERLKISKLTSKNQLADWYRRLIKQMAGVIEHKGERHGEGAVGSDVLHAAVWDRGGFQGGSSWALAG